MLFDAPQLNGGVQDDVPLAQRVFSHQPIHALRLVDDQADGKPLVGARKVRFPVAPRQARRGRQRQGERAQRFHNQRGDVARAVEYPHIRSARQQHVQDDVAVERAQRHPHMRRKGLEPAEDARHMVGQQGFAHRQPQFAAQFARPQGAPDMLHGLRQLP